MGLPRQKVNYHLRALEAHKLVEPAEERRWGGLTERLMVATAASYVVSPAALGPIAADPARNNDRVSASYLIAVAARIVGEVSGLWRAARQQDKRLATLSVDTVVRFKSPADRAAFTSDLAEGHRGAGGALPRRVITAGAPAPAGGRLLPGARWRHTLEEARTCPSRKTAPASAGSKWSSLPPARLNRYGRRWPPAPATRRGSRKARSTNASAAR